MKYDIFHDLLIIILTLAAVTITLFGFIAYRLLRDRLEKHSTELMNKIYLKAVARSLNNIGWSFWDIFAKDRSAISHLENAIELTDYAYREFVCQLDCNERDSRKLLILIRNNLAYYYAELCSVNRALTTERQLALDYADYLRQIWYDFPEITSELIVTCGYVEIHCRNYTPPQQH